MPEYKVSEFSNFPDYLPPKFSAEERKIISKALRLVSRTYTRGLVFTTPDVAIDFFKLHLAGLEREHFVMVCLNTRHRMLKCFTLHQGTVDGAEVYPREVVKAALSVNASAVLFGHNHPSGEAKPSSADQTLTKQLKKALDIVGVRVLDHIIIAGEQTYSFARAGAL